MIVTFVFDDCNICLLCNKLFPFDELSFLLIYKQSSHFVFCDGIVYTWMRIFVSDQRNIFNSGKKHGYFKNHKIENLQIKIVILKSITSNMF